MSQALCFKEVQFDVIPQNSQLWVRGYQIGTALGYGENADVSIRKLYTRHADEFTPAMTAVVTLPTEGGPQDTRIFSLRGCHLLAMFARTPVAKQFRRWVLDVLDKLAEEERANSSRNFPENPGNSLSPAERAELKALVDAKLSAAPTELQGKARSEIWTRFNRHFRIAEYAQLPADKMPDAREYLIQMTVNALRPTVQAQVSTTLPPAEEAETHLLAIGEHIRLIRSHEAALFQLSRKALPPIRKPQDMFSPARRMGLSAFQTMEDCSSTLDYSLKALEASIRTIFSLNRM